MDECCSEFGAEVSGKGHSQCRAYDDDRGPASREQRDPAIRAHGA